MACSSRSSPRVKIDIPLQPVYEELDDNPFYLCTAERVSEASYRFIIQEQAVCISIENLRKLANNLIKIEGYNQQLILLLEALKKELK